MNTAQANRDRISRSSIAKWLTDCRARGIRLEIIHRGVLYLTRDAQGRGLAWHMWKWGACYPSSQDVRNQDQI